LPQPTPTAEDPPELTKAPRARAPVKAP
jgi:hypothetical protein